ncbi:MAG: transposase, partial [Acidobacteriia bacterium]|nr:transposase [Terriglobia bacterium]
EYKRLGTVSLLAGLDLHTGRVTEIVSDHHASVDFIALLGKLDEGYSPQTRIRILLDNHSAHTSKETQAWLAKTPPQKIRVRLHADTRLMAQHRRDHVQQNGAQHAAGYPRRQQTGLIASICTSNRSTRSPSSFAGGIKWTRPAVRAGLVVSWFRR